VLAQRHRGELKISPKPNIAEFNSGLASTRMAAEAIKSDAFLKQIKVLGGVAFQGVDL
jgi:hypothetical protein